MSAPTETDTNSDAGFVRGRIEGLVVHSTGNSFRFGHERVQTRVEQLPVERVDQGRIFEEWL